MAKTVTKFTRPVAPRTVLDAGIKYIFTDLYVMPSKIKIPQGYTLRECNDGWYQMYDLRGWKSFLAFGRLVVAGYLEDKIIKQITDL